MDSKLIQQLIEEQEDLFPSAEGPELDQRVATAYPYAILDVEAAVIKLGKGNFVEDNGRYFDVWFKVPTGRFLTDKVRLTFEKNIVGGTRCKYVSLGNLDTALNGREALSHVVQTIQSVEQFLDSIGK